MDTHERNGTEADGGRTRTYSRRPAAASSVQRPWLGATVRSAILPEPRGGSLSRRDGGDGDGAATDRAESHGVGRRRTSANLEVKIRVAQARASRPGGSF